MTHYLPEQERGAGWAMFGQRCHRRRVLGTGVSGLWVKQGYFNQIGVDLHETLSAPLVGDVLDLAGARAAIDRRIVTKGNLNLDFLQTATPEQCAAAATEIVRQVAGDPHLLGATDAILYGTPAVNLRAVAAVGQGAHHVSHA